MAGVDFRLTGGVMPDCPLIFMIAARPLALPPPFKCPFKCRAKTLTLTSRGHRGHSTLGNIVAGFGFCSIGGGEGAGDSNEESAPSIWLLLTDNRLAGFGFCLRVDPESSLGKGSPYISCHGLSMYGCLLQYSIPGSGFRAPLPSVG
jgi:hypothetical protein